MISHIKIRHEIRKVILYCSKNILLHNVHFLVHFSYVAILKTQKLILKFHLISCEATFR